MNESAAAEENAVIRECLEGRTDRFSILVDRYKSMAFTVAFRMLGDQDAANDMAQESFISAYTGLKDFRADSKFSTWLYRIVMNKCRDYLRSGRNSAPLDEVAELRSDPGKTPEQEASGHETRKLIQAALAKLPHDYREVVVLKHIEELDFKEISDILGVGVTALKVRAHRAREMLREILENTGERHDKGQGIDS